MADLSFALLESSIQLLAFIMSRIFHWISEHGRACLTSNTTSSDIRGTVEPPFTPEGAGLSSPP